MFLSWRSLWDKPLDFRPAKPRRDHVPVAEKASDLLSTSNIHVVQKRDSRNPLNDDPVEGGRRISAFAKIGSPKKSIFANSRLSSEFTRRASASKLWLSYSAERRI